jgi:DNA-binding Lrp family transcriptional regulator
MLLDDVAIRFINQFQGGFPLSAQPFQRVAEMLDSDEKTIIKQVRHLLEAGYLSRFGPLYDAQQMGGGLTLAALSVPEARFDKVTDIVNGFAEVAHNYRREHELNMWFVIATETESAVSAVIEKIESATGLQVFNCPKQKEFFVGLQLKIDQTGQAETVPMNAAWLAQPTPEKISLDELDRQIIRQTQGGLPLQSEPYEAIAKTLDEPLQTVLQRLQKMLDKGVIRRIGAVPNHYQLGLRGNGMTVWNVPDERIDEIGKKIAAMDFVSHCYQRPRHLPQWPYNLFAMVHGADKQQALAKVSSMQQMLAPDEFPHQVLFSSAVLKKTGLRIAA